MVVIERMAVNAFATQVKRDGTYWRFWKKPFRKTQLQNQHVTPAKAGFQNVLKEWDSGFRRNDTDGLSEFAQNYAFCAPLSTVLQSK